MQRFIYTGKNVAGKLKNLVSRFPLWRRAPSLKPQYDSSATKAEAIKDEYEVASIESPASLQSLHSDLSNRVSECTSYEDLYSYKAQRWMWNEALQLESRYVKFDVDALCKVAEVAAGNNAKCHELMKFSEGNFNKAFLVAMRDGRQVVVKLPNPNAGRAHYTTASEVATLDYVCVLWRCYTLENIVTLTETDCERESCETG